MRVISGTARGMKLISPQGKDVRPTTDRVKESLFNIISDRLYDAQILDLYAGSGSLGIESISRGSKKGIFCEKSKKNIEIIKLNIEKARFLEKSEIICGDSLNILKKLSDKKMEFDIIFVDPPYYENLFEKTLFQINDLNLLSKNGIVVVEHDTKQKFSDFKSLKIIKEKKYGMTTLTFFSLEEEKVDE